MTQPLPRAPSYGWWPVVAGLVVGIVGMVGGSLLPLLPLYIAGLVVVVALVAWPVGTLVRARGTGRPRASRLRGPVVFVLLVAMGVAVPWGVGRWVVNRDVVWQQDVAGEAHVVGDRVYLLSRDGIDVFDRATGEAAWSVPGYELWITADGGIITRGSDSSPERYDAAGELMWDAAAVAGLRGPRAVAATDDTAVFADCEYSPITEPVDCVLTGVDNAGERTWERTFSDAGLPQWDVVKGSRAARISAGLAVRIEPERAGRARTLILDPDSGRTMRTVSTPGESVAGVIIPLDDGRIVFGRRAGERCRLVSYDGRDRQWASALARPCRELRSSDVVQHYDDRAYLRVDSSYATIDLDTGDARVLDWKEYDAQRPWAGLGHEIVVNHLGGEVVAYDAATGEELWRRETSADADIHVGDGVVVKGASHVPDPVLRPGVRLHGGDPENELLEFDDWSRLLIVLDPRTGDEVGRVVDPDGSAADTAIRTGQTWAVVSHSYWSGVYLVGED